MLEMIALKLDTHHCTLGAALPDVWLKPYSYGFRSVKTLYGRNFDRTPKLCGFLVSNMKLEM